MNRALIALLFAGCAADEASIEYTGETHRFVVDAIELPRTNTQAREFGLTIDSNKTVDNMLGMVVSTLSQYGDITTHAPDMMAAGVLASSVEIVADDFQNDDTVAIRYYGADGEASEIIGGELVDGSFVATRPGGAAVLHLPIFVDADPNIVQLVYARMVIAPDGAGGYTGRLGGGVDDIEAKREAFKGALQMLDAHPSEHLTLLQLLDANYDDEVTEYEWEHNSLIQALMASDLRIDNHDLLSIGFQLHLTPCAEGHCSTAPPANTCFDRLLDGNESDLDCGGSCSTCSAAHTCTQASDCESNACNGGLCAAPSCTDGVRDGFETDVDCGTSDCGACAIGQGCYHDSDCTSGHCGPPCTGSFCFDTYERCQ